MSPLSVLLNQVSYPQRQRVKDDINQLMDYLKSLMPKVSTFVHNNGMETKLIAIIGTVPIFYGGSQYNIPVEIFIPLNYPNECPKMFVRPTANMTIKANHRHVDMQGCVYLPYLHEWKTTSNLQGLAEVASGVFSIEPPLFSKPAVGTVQTSSSSSSSAVAAKPSATPTPVVAAVAYPSYPSSTNNAIGASGATTGSGRVVTVLDGPSSSSSAAAAASITTTGNVLPINTTSNGQSGSTSFANANPVNPAAFVNPAAASLTNNNSSTNTSGDPLKRLNLIEEVTMKMQGCIHKHHLQARDDLSTELEIQNYLNCSHDQAKENTTSLLAMIQDMEKHLETINKQKVKFEEEKDRVESAWKNQIAEDQLVVEDDVSQQIFQLHGQVQAIDDAFYFLDKALTNHVLDSNVYLKEVRNLSRQQFLAKLHLKKIEKVMEGAGSNTAALFSYGTSNPGSNTNLIDLGGVNGSGGGRGPPNAMMSSGSVHSNPASGKGNNGVFESGGGIAYNSQYNVALANGRYLPPAAATPTAVATPVAYPAL
eukprot:gene8593-9469_t